MRISLKRGGSLLVAAPLVLAGLGVALAAPALAGDAPLIPLSNVEGEHVCQPAQKRHLYERGGIYFCTAAANLTRWPKRVRYAVLGIDIARFEPEIAAVIAEVHTITGAEMVRGGTPDLVVFLDTEVLDEGQIRALAGKAGVQLSDTDVRYIKFGFHLNLYPGRGGGGGMTGGAGIAGDAAIANFDARRSPDDEDNAYTRSIRAKLRDYVLGFFGVEPPMQGFICTRDNGPPLVGPTGLDRGTDGLTCPHDRLLTRSGDQTFCGRPIPFWPRTITYAAIGPEAGVHESEINAAAARLAKLTGLTIVAGSKPEVVIALVDRPFDDDAGVRAALAEAHVATPPEDTDDLMTSLSGALYEKRPPGTMLGVRTEYCDIELQQMIRTDGRSPDAIRRDIDNTFLRILEITPPIRQTVKRETKP